MSRTADRKGPKFAYIFDPLCLVCCFLYALNRWAIKPNLPIDESFMRGHFNDLLLIPCALPPLLYLHRKFRLRKVDIPPTALEVGLHLVVWSLVCEAVGPAFVAGTTADPWDVVAYGVGAVVSWVVWNRAWRRLDGSVVLG